jgi:hypothetical protein
MDKLPIEIIKSLLEKFTFEYIEGSGRKLPNAHHILANMLLVLGYKRIAFLLQPGDYQDEGIYKKILELVLSSIDQFTDIETSQGYFIAIETSQGYLITLTNHIESISGKNLNDDKVLGDILSYPCAGDLLSPEEFMKSLRHNRSSNHIVRSSNHIVTKSNKGDVEGDVMSNICFKKNEKKFEKYFIDIEKYMSRTTRNKIQLQYIRG